MEVISLKKAVGRANARSVLQEERRNQRVEMKKQSKARSLARNKKIINGYKSGGCSLCGYDKCLAALQFHHLDPNEKDLAISRIRGGSLERLIAGIEKCTVLCANCHTEEHDRLERLKKARL